MDTYVRELSGQCYPGRNDFTCPGEAVAFYLKEGNTTSGLDMLFWRNEETSQPELVYSLDKGGMLLEEHE